MAGWHTVVECASDDSRPQMTADIWSWPAILAHLQVKERSGEEREGTYRGPPRLVLEPQVVQLGSGSAPSEKREREHYMGGLEQKERADKGQMEKNEKEKVTIQQSGGAHMASPIRCLEVRALESVSRARAVRSDPLVSSWLKDRSQLERS